MIYFPRRYILLVLIFFGSLIDKLIRVTLSVAIIPISKETHWDEATQGLVLASFFIGYSLLQTFASSLGKRFGFRLVFGLGLAGGCPFVILFPFVVHNVPLAVLLQVACGLFHSVIYPCIYHMFTVWFPKFEVSKAIAIMGCGGITGMVISWSVSSKIIEYLGWPSLFYIVGGAGLIWLVPWLLFTLESPEDKNVSCFTPSIEEIEFIKSNQTTIEEDPHFSVPWKRILTCWPFIVLTINQFTANWIYYIFMSWSPNYYKARFNPSLDEVGIYSLIPMPLYMFLLLFSGFVADFLSKRQLLPLRTIRRIFQSLALGIPVVSFVILATLGNALSLPVTIFLVTLALASLGFGAGGKDSNFVDLNTKYSAALFAVANVVGSIPGIVGVYLTGFILEETGDDWSVVFYLSGALSLFAVLLFFVFVRTEIVDFDSEEGDQEYLLKNKEKPLKI